MDEVTTQPRVALTFAQLPTRAARDEKNKAIVAAGGIPSNELCQEDVFDWYAMQDQLSALKASEMLMRQKIYKTMFVDPKEGTNKSLLPDGWELKAQRVVERKVDEGALAVLSSKITNAQGGEEPSVFEKNGISADKVIRWKPELAKAAYNTLTAEQQKIVDRALIIKDGSPQLEIVLPAKNDPTKKKTVR